MTHIIPVEIPEFLKDPSAVLDYKWDWKSVANGSSEGDEIGNWLESGETITNHTITVPSGLTKDSSALADTDTSVVAWLSGGTAWSDYVVVCQIVTSAGRTEERSIRILVRDR